MRQIVAATENPGKLAAVQAAFEEIGPVYGWDSFSITASKSESGVAKSPDSDEMGLEGCRNRIKYAKELYPDADLYIALEGVISTTNTGEAYVRGWTMIEDVLSSRVVSASGASVEVPDFIATKMDADHEFSDLVREVYPLEEHLKKELRNIGANGVFTNKEYGRHDSFYDGIRICLSLLSNDSNWPKDNQR